MMTKWSWTITEGDKNRGICLQNSSTESVERGNTGVLLSVDNERNMSVHLEHRGSG